MLQRRARTATQHPERFQGTARAFEASLANEVWLILAAIVTVYIVLGRAVRELYPPHHDSFDLALGRSRRDSRAADLPRWTWA